MEVYGANGYAITVALDHLRVRYHGQENETPDHRGPVADGRQDALDYFAASFTARSSQTGDLSALDTNMVVMQILDAARQSAQTGRTVELQPLPQ